MRERRHILFVGSPVGMQRWLNENRHHAGPDWHVHLALNGVEHLRGIYDRFKIVHERGWLPPDDPWAVDEAISYAKRINGDVIGDPQTAEEMWPA